MRVERVQGTSLRHRNWFCLEYAHPIPEQYDIPGIGVVQCRVAPGWLCGSVIWLF